MDALALPPVEQIVAEIEARRAELAALKKLPRACKAASDAERAQRRCLALASEPAGSQEARDGR